ncbi:MAG: Malate/L-lactate dehydrogenase [Devosia sp.]|uniref:Ldh family oxidoreductase n=1 Tax=Devosia sp. TaxID=1871048 RepID=UPI002624F384|nr:Ldh family oxidoreductase [Devosia sp.]MDB5539706.1 Malate/L-lactate dehydrogenase [Devosia sp.]
MVDTGNDAAFDSDALRDWSARVFAAAGMPVSDAETAADLLVRTSLRGIDTHGISRLPLYVESLLEGRINPRPDHGGEMRDGILHYRGDHGLGQAVGVAAVKAALELAKDRAVVPCLAKQCGHLAALGSYVLLAAEAGMIGFICQSTTPLMALEGWTDRAIGNNPLAFGTPLENSAPLVFDMSSSVVARGNLRDAVREKRNLPAGWAIGPDGKPTTDAETGFAGAVLPVGGYKGIGIAMMVQVLAGSLLGNSTNLGPDSTSSNEMGAFLLIINPALVNDAYAADVDVWLSRYRKVAGAQGRYPGQRAAASEVSRRRTGIPVPPVSLQHLRAIGNRVGQPFSLEVKTA